MIHITNKPAAIIDNLLSKVSNSIQNSNTLLGSQQQAIECQLHVSSSSCYSACSPNDASVDDVPKSSMTITQSRLLIHQDLQHEAIPEEDFDQQDDDNEEQLMANFSRYFLNFEDDNLIERKQKKESEVSSDTVDEVNEDPKKEEEIYHTGTFLYAHRADRNKNRFSNNSSSPSSPSVASSQQQTATILLAGDRAAGKTTFAAIVSGLSLATQRLLRLHATSLVNTWFNPSEDDLQYFAGEFNHHQADDTNSSSDNNNNKSSSISDNARRLLPLLPSQLCITSLHGLSEDFDLFLEDEELRDDVVMIGDDDIQIGDHHHSTARVWMPSTMKNRNDCTSSHYHLQQLSSISDFTTVRLVEVGGDLLDMMVKNNVNVNNNDNHHSHTDETTRILLDSAHNAFSSAQRILYFFDASSLSPNTTTSSSSSVADFKYFLKTLMKSGGSSQQQRTTQKSILIIMSRVPTASSTQIDKDKATSTTPCSTCISKAEQMFGIISTANNNNDSKHSDNNHPNNEDEQTTSSSLLSLLTCPGNPWCFAKSFLQVAIRFARMKLSRNRDFFKEEQEQDGDDDIISGCMIPQYKSDEFGLLEDSVMFLLQNALKTPTMMRCDDDESQAEDEEEADENHQNETKNENKSSTVTSLFHPSPIATDAKIAQLLFACNKFIQFIMLRRRTTNKNFVSDEDHRRKDVFDFILSVENCTRAIRFAFDEHHDHHHHQNNDNNNHNNSRSTNNAHHSCEMCRGREYQTQHHHCEGNNHHHKDEDDDDSFCLSRNFEYCPPLALARSVPYLLEVLEKEEGRRSDRDLSTNESSSMEKGVVFVERKKKRDQEKEEEEEEAGTSRSVLVVSARNCLALYWKYERKTLMNGF